MASLKQLEANRRNSKKSTGPTSAAGKAASRMNACKSGLHAKSLIIPGEKAADLQALIDEYYALYLPPDPDSRDLVDDLILCIWQIRRLALTEVELYKYLKADLWKGDSEKHPQGKVSSLYEQRFCLLQRRLDSARRARNRARDAIQDLPAKAAGTGNNPPLATENPPQPAPTVNPADPNPAPSTPNLARRRVRVPLPDPSLEIGFVPSLSPASAGVPESGESPGSEPKQAA